MKKAFCTCVWIMLIFTNLYISIFGIIKAYSIKFNKLEYTPKTG